MPQAGCHLYSFPPPEENPGKSRKKNKKTIRAGASAEKKPPSPFGRLSPIISNYEQI